MRATARSTKYRMVYALRKRDVAGRWKLRGVYREKYSAIDVACRDAKRYAGRLQGRICFVQKLREANVRRFFGRVRVQ